MKTAVRKPATRAKKPKGPVNFLHLPDCETCRKARSFMQRRGYKLRFRDLAENRLSVAELEKLIGKRNHTDFLNTRSGTYRKENMKEDPPSRRDAIRLMARDPRLIRRPVIASGGQVIIGYDKNGMVKLF